MPTDIALLLARVVNLASNVLSIVLIAYIVLSYFMSPYHPVRMTLGRIVEPLLLPIRRLMPNTGMIDFSPLVLMVLIQVVEFVLVRLFVALA
ncbi:MAG TPA: YggT family protein [Anaerolineales bacterium]|nr:YggT family protein [Anaerolineales bacterium]